MEEREEGVIAAGTSVMIRLAIVVDPPPWVEEFRCWTVKGLRSIARIRSNEQAGASRNLSAQYRGVLLGYSEGERCGWHEAKCFVTDAIQYRQAFEIV